MSKELAQMYFREATSYLDGDKGKWWKAIPRLRKAIKLNPQYLEAILLLRKCYRLGKGVRMNYSKVAALELEAAHLGHVPSQSSTGENYYHGWGFNQDYVEAIKWFQSAAERGDACAQCYLGVAFEYGDGVPKDHLRAIQFYRKAALKEYVPAIYLLGLVYEKGLGVEQDISQAKILYEKAFNSWDFLDYEGCIGDITAARERLDGRFIYFAYGSNMFIPRLKSRAASARTIGWGYVEGCQLEFDKVSEDGSGKATIVQMDHEHDGLNSSLKTMSEVAMKIENNKEGKDTFDEMGNSIERRQSESFQYDKVWGVLFSVGNEDQEKLDRAEGVGHGYQKMRIHLDHYMNETMALLSTTRIWAETYVATKRDAKYLPYDWYKNYVITGAVEQKFPEDYIEYLQQIPSKIDQNKNRREREESFLSNNRHA